MAIYTNAGGGGGLDTDELTATAGDVLKGKTAGVKGSDEPVAGTLELTGNAADSQVLSGQTYYNTDAKTKRTGTMPNQGAKTASLNCGGSYTIPAGYHNGAGKVTANSLASQTGGVTAEDKYVYNGKTYWRDGVKRTGNMTVSSVVSFSVATYSTTQVTATWQWPSTGPYSGIIIRGKVGGYPTSVSDGTVGYQGTGSNVALGGKSSITISGLTTGNTGVTYYFRAWVYCSTSTGTLYSGYLQATAATQPKGQQIFTGSGTFTVPANVTKIDVFCVGGGGAGGKQNYSSERIYVSGGGAGGYTVTQKGISVSPGQQYTVTVGAGSKNSTSSVNRGGDSSFNGTAISAKGGSSGIYNWGGWQKGGSGGSGGGASYARYYDADGNLREGQTPGNGGSDGGTGDKGSYTGSLAYYGSGQGSTTRAFGDVNGTLYAGGGAGADYAITASGGAGGGGNSNVNGAANTGGGAGASTYAGGIREGGSGIVIVRWGY